MYFFFFKQKTAYEMRISDWSSDVCSSDLNRRAKLRLDVVADDRNACLGETLRPYRIAGDEDGDVVHECDASLQRAFRVKLGRFLASDRQIVNQDLGSAFPQHANDLRPLGFSSVRDVESAAARIILHMICTALTHAGQQHGGYGRQKGRA